MFGRRMKIDRYRGRDAGHDDVVFFVLVPMVEATVSGSPDFSDFHGLGLGKHEGLGPAVDCRLLTIYKHPGKSVKSLADPDSNEPHDRDTGSLGVAGSH